MHGSQSEKDAVLPVYNKVMLDGAHKGMMRELLNPEPEQKDMFGAMSGSQTPSNTPYSGYQNQVLARAQNALTTNIPYKKLGQP